MTNLENTTLMNEEEPTIQNEDSVECSECPFFIECMAESANSFQN